jgi:hypothetical protein
MGPRWAFQLHGVSGARALGSTEPPHLHSNSAGAAGIAHCSVQMSMSDCRWMGFGQTPVSRKAPKGARHFQDALSVCSILLGGAYRMDCGRSQGFPMLGRQLENFHAPTVGVRADSARSACCPRSEQSPLELRCCARHQDPVTDSCRDHPEATRAPNRYPSPNHPSKGLIGVI